MGRKSYLVLAAACALAVSFAPRPSFAQDWSAQFSGEAQAVAATPEAAPDVAAVSGPTIYVVDKNRRLATVNLGTGAVHVIGLTGPQLTDIAFDPKNHVLYGITFSGFYVVDKANARTAFVGGLGQNDANSLVFNSAGVAFSAGVNTAELYRIDVANGRASVVGSTHGYASAGDLTFYDDHLVLAAFRGARNITTSTPNYLATLNEKTGAVEGTPVALPVKELFGLVSTGKNELYGLALYGSHAGLYRIAPTETTYAKRAVLLEDLTSKGLSQILGAAYDGNYQP